LPCSLCRASPHGKGVAELILTFAVRFGCTAKLCCAVVIREMVKVGGNSLKQ
jgi:hypothetical protein